MLFPLTLSVNAKRGLPSMPRNADSPPWHTSCHASSILGHFITVCQGDKLCLLWASSSSSTVWIRKRWSIVWHPKVEAANLRSLWARCRTFGCKHATGGSQCQRSALPVLSCRFRRQWANQGKQSIQTWWCYSIFSFLALVRLAIGLPHQAEIVQGESQKLQPGEKPSLWAPLLPCNEPWKEVRRR